MKQDRLTTIEKRKWLPIRDSIIEKCGLYAQHVTGRDGLFLARPDVIQDGARKLARIKDWDEGGILVPDHLRRIESTIWSDHILDAVADRFLYRRPSGEVEKTTGSVPLWVVFSHDNEPLGWCVPQPRRDGMPATIWILRGRDNVGIAAEHLTRRAKTSRPQPDTFFGQVWSAKSRELMYDGRMTIRRVYFIAKFSDLEPGELGLDIDRRVAESRGLDNAAMVRLTYQEYVTSHEDAVRDGDMVTLHSIAIAQGRDIRSLEEEILADLFGDGRAA